MSDPRTPNTSMSTGLPGRRFFLASLGAAGAASLLRGLPATAQASARRIDIHQHFVSPSFYATLNAKNATSPVPGLAAWKGYSPASAVEALDRVGIATAMLSITAPGVWFGDVQEARKLAARNVMSTPRYV